MWVLHNVVNLISAVVVIVVGALINRALNRHDKRIQDSEASKEARLVRIEKTLNRHTRSLSALTRASKLAVDTLARHSEDIEELEDATEQLHLATSSSRERIEKSEKLITELREQRLGRN